MDISVYKHNPLLFDCQRESLQFLVNSKVLKSLFTTTPFLVIVHQQPNTQTHLVWRKAILSKVKKLHSFCHYSTPMNSHNPHVLRIHASTLSLLMDRVRGWARKWTPELPGATSIPLVPWIFPNVVPQGNAPRWGPGGKCSLEMHFVISILDSVSSSQSLHRDVMIS